MKVYSEIFKSLADETRLTILTLLIIKKELCVCDVEGILNISQSKASRHLRYLKNAGLINDRRNGIWVYYRLNTDKDHKAYRILKANKTLISSFADSRLKADIDNWFAGKQGTACSAG